MPEKWVNGQYGDWNDEQGRWNKVYDPSQIPGGANASNTGVAGPAYPTQPQQPQQPQLSREQYRDLWMSQGGNASIDSLKQFVQQYGGNILNESSGYTETPYGERLDLLINADRGGPGGSRAAWTEVDDYNRRGAVGGGDAGATATGTGGGGGFVAPAGSGGGFNTGGLGSQAQGLFDLLMERARRSENIDPNDPIIKAQTDAYRAQGEQARRDFLASQAEREGLYGNLRSEERRSAEELGKSVGGFQAQAMQNELAARRAQIESALAGAAGFLTDQQRMALQNELARLQLAQQESQFSRSLTQRGSEFGGDLGYRYAALGQSGSQFDRSLGQQAYQFDTSRWDRLFAGV